MEVNTKDKQVSDAIKKYEIKTLPLLIMYKKGEKVLREVPSFATIEKIHRIVSILIMKQQAFGIRQEDREDWVDNGLYF